ncbi:hypothetical protein T12_16534 [Trichinella patagoniensis]|uniref:Reverse transcriptase/retrotransposon-derived protein RNase H-like domain-containing protein n=1 Tax=Trichinella patagoniensis TaxID=990121 RepID=A0A0V0Z960_9BILA|nr:hypothetical protein T12_16534 [Trichinella patagoniensis]
MSVFSLVTLRTGRWLRCVAAVVEVDLSLVTFAQGVVCVWLCCAAHEFVVWLTFPIDEREAECRQRFGKCVAVLLTHRTRKEQLTLADSASLPELDLLPFLFGLIRNPYRNGNTRQRWIKLPKDAVKAFEEAKQAIVNATLLSHPRDDEALSLEVDASDFAADAMDGGLPWRSSLADLNPVKPGTVRLDASCWPSVWSYVAFNIGLKDDISPS